MLWSGIEGSDYKQKTWFIRGGPQLQAQAGCCLNAEVGAVTHLTESTRANNCNRTGQQTNAPLYYG